jgi:hypothetical protein
MNRGDIVFRVRGLRLNDIGPDELAAYLGALSKLIGPSKLVRITSHTVVLRRHSIVPSRSSVPPEKPT